MSGSPFDGGAGEWLVVVNPAEQYALWRPHLDLPRGWRVVHRDAERDGALDHVERHSPGLTAAPAA
jgi:MbtH protein